MGEYKHIYAIKSPEYLKDKSIEELEEIAKEIREFCAPCLGHDI